MPRKDIKIGAKVGFLTVIEKLEKLKSDKYTNCLCICECGNTRIVRMTYLLREETISCGCKNFISKPHGNSIYLPKESSFRAKASNYRANARLRGIRLTLSIEEIVILMKGNCYYCGRLPSNKYNVRLSNRDNNKCKNNYVKMASDMHHILYNGIDRFNNDEGYTFGNSVSCCTQCNTAKLDFSVKEFKEWIVRLYENFILKNDETNETKR